MSNFEGYRIASSSRRSTRCRRRRCGPATSRSCWQPRGHQPADRPAAGIVVDPAQCTVVGTTRTCAPFPGNSIPANRIHADLEEAARVLSGAEQRHRRTHQQLPVAAGSRDRQEPVHAAHRLRAELASTWMGRYSYSHDNEITPALKLNGTKLDNTDSSGRCSATPGRCRRRVVNEFRFGYNSFFNTFGRELAFVRDVDQGAGHPRHLADSRPRRGAFRASASPGSAASATAPKGRTPTEQGVRVHRQRVVDSRAGTRSRSAAASGSTMYNQVGNQFPRGSFQFDGQQRIATAASRRVRRLPARLPRSSPNRRSRWR